MDDRRDASSSIMMSSDCTRTGEIAQLTSNVITMTCISKKKKNPDTATTPIAAEFDEDDT